MISLLEKARAGNVTGRIQRRVRAAQARARYRLGIPVPGPEDVGIDRRFQHPIDISCRSLIAARYLDRFPDAAHRELVEARRLAAHQFRLLGHAVDHGPQIAWSRDPVSGREWSRGFSADIAYRGPDRLGDIKLPWELNKHQYFFTLGKAAWLSGNQATAVEIVNQIDHWIEDNPYQRGINWISALETGSRVISWVMAYPFYAEYCSASFRQRFAKSLAQHLLFVEEHLSTGRFANTHLIGEAAALVAGGLFLECSHSERWIATGLQLLDQEIDRQVTPDAVHAERSVAYHRFFLDYYYLVGALLAANQRALAPATRAAMERMTSVLMHVVFPDGTAPAFGDADDARGLWLRADCPADYRGLLALGAVLFDRGDFKAAAGRVSEEVLWLFGPDGVTTFDDLTAQAPEAASIAYPDGGYYVMRSGWGASDAALLFDCGPLGFGPAGHGHADALSIQLHAAGYPFLVDPGTFSYNIDYAWRDEFRRTRAHNTVVVDGQDQSVPRDRLSWTHVAHAQPRRWVTTPWFDVADGEHDGYRRLVDPVSHRRAVMFLKPDVWVVWDTVKGKTPHAMECLLHVRPDCRVDVGPGGEGCLTSPDGERLQVRVSGPHNEPLRLNVVNADDQHRAAWFSPGYGTRVPSRMLTVEQPFEGTGSLVTCLSAGGGPGAIVAHESGAMHVSITRGEGCDESLFYRPEGSGVLEARGVRFDGTLLFHSSARGRTPVVWGSSFRELTIDGLIEVRAPMAISIDSIVLHDDRCEMLVRGGRPGDVQVTLPKHVRLVMSAV